MNADEPEVEVAAGYSDMVLLPLALAQFHAPAGSGAWPSLPCSSTVPSVV